MRHILILSAILFMSLSTAVAQEKKEKFDIQKFKEKKADYIVSELKLSESEAEAFIPLMNEFMDKRFQLNREIRTQSRELRTKQGKTNADYDKYIESRFDNKTKELALEKEYYHKFKKVLSPEKIYQYHKAEANFMKKIVSQQKEKSNSQKQRGRK